MIGGADERVTEDVVRPSTHTTTLPPPPSPPPPIAPPSSPAQPPSLGRRLLGSIRALASHPAPPPAAPATKVGLGLLLDLRSGHPRLHPTPSASPAPPAFASASEEDGDGDAAAARPHAAAERDAGAGPHLSASNQCRPDDGAAPANTTFRRSGASSEEENLAGGTEKVGEQQRAAVHRKGAAFVKDVAAAAGPDDQQEKACTGHQLRAARDGDQERDAIHPRAGRTTYRGIAAQDDQEKAVQQCDTRELGTADNDGDDADQEAVEQGLIETAMDDDNAAKDHEVLGQSFIAGTEMHAAIDVQDQHKGVEATVLFSKAVSATVNGSDRGIGKKEKVKLTYRQRPGKLNCPTHMSKGSCSYGDSCQFHHPQLKAKPDGSRFPSEQGNHGVVDILELNRTGLPIREGARNCTYYVRNGTCRYGKHCHFNHPEHAFDAQFYAPTGWEDSTLELDKSSDHHTTLDDTPHLKKSSDNATLDDTSYSKRSSDHATLDDTSYSKKSSDHATIDDTSSSSEVLPPNMLRTLLSPQKVLPGIEGNVMQVKKDSNWSSTSDNSDGCCSADSSDGPLCKQQQQYPERPGQPDCRYYLQFRKCKFLSTCIFHHPRDGLPVGWNPSGPAHSDQIRPVIHGMPECPFYMKSGKCQFGSACEFRHPIDTCSTTEGPFGQKQEQTLYPERPGVPRCFYYMRYGSCRFQMNCRYHHPADRLSRKQVRLDLPLNSSTSTA